MTATYIQPFDFKTIFVNYFLGNQTLFPFALMIIVSIVCAYFQMSNTVFLIILTISSIMFGAYLGEATYFLVLFIVGFVVFKAFSRIFQ